MYLDDYFEKAFADRQMLGATTRSLYRIDLRRFTQQLGRRATIYDLTDDAVSSGMVKMLDLGFAVETVNGFRKHLVALWTFAAKRGDLASWPTVKRLKEPQRIPEAWFTTEIRQILGGCPLQVGDYCGVARSLWWAGIHWFWWFGGERRTAALGIERAWVRIDRGEILVRAEVRKGKTRDKLYLMRGHGLDALRAIWLPDRKMLFPFPFSEATFYNHYHRVLEAAGLPVHRRNGPQKMRRSFASYLEAAGGNATQALDHERRSVTTGSYLDPRICGGQNPSDLLPEL